MTKENASKLWRIILEASDISKGQYSSVAKFYREVFGTFAKKSPRITK